MTVSPSAIAGDFAGRYTVERELGRGATSIVWLAQDREHGRSVAIKILREELASDVAAERFLREVRVTAQLHHPNIVPVLNSGAHAGRLFFVLPYLDGGTLRARLDRDKQLPVAEVVAIGLTIASALASAHEKNVLHRDVKPENILFTGGQACLADFGIARAIIHASGESTTSTGLVRGTPAYMSPEQASGDRDYDGRSDLYSLACVLYEALAGVPAFVGATSQQIVSQRLLHEPRPVRVFRPSVSAELEAVLERALATAPADRYQTATEFGAALSSARIGPTREHVAMPTARRRRAFGLLAIPVVVTLGVMLATQSRWRERLLPEPPLDTTRFAILPFAGASQFADSSRPEDLLVESMRRWRGLSLVESFEIGDAIRRRGVPSSIVESARLARQLGAGRFVRGQLARAAGQRTIVAALYDSKSAKPLHEVRMSVAAESSQVISTYRRLADSIVLRSQRTEMPLDTVGALVSLPATQLMLQAADAMRNWNLSVAESLYAGALGYDPTSARAALWVAQFQAWFNEAPRSTYGQLAHRAASDTSLLSGDDRTLATALAAQSDGDYPAACALYDGMTKRSPRQFAGWFGLAQCYDRDRLVIPDAASPTGWRFRTSYRLAIDAYVRAFDLLPSVYRSYESSAYQSLRGLLYTSTRYRRRGSSVGKTPRVFMAAPTWSGDSLTFWPQPLEDVLQGRASIDADATALAITHNRALFQRIASGWATAFPQSPGAKEGLALSMEIQGDPAALDTLRAALRLASEPTQRLRLLVQLVWLDTKFGIPDDLARLSDARRLADSIVRVANPTNSIDADLMARLAALTGRCATATRLTRLAAHALAAPVVQTQQNIADIDARAVLVTLGCTIPSSLPSIDQIADHVGLASLSPAMRPIVESDLFARLIRNADTLNVSWGERLAPRDYLIAARTDLAHGRRDSARTRMLALDGRRRGGVRGDFTPDAALPEARVWLALGDTARAVQWLDRTLSAARYLPPMDALQPADNAIIAASLVRALALRAELSTTRRERARWANAVITLWGGGDADLQPIVARMRALAQ